MTAVWIMARTCDRVVDVNDRPPIDRWHDSRFGSWHPWLELTRENGISRLQIGPIALAEFADVLCSQSGYAFIHDQNYGIGLSHYEERTDPATGERALGAVPLVEICDRLSLTVEAEDSDNVLLTMSDFAVLIEELQHYQLNVAGLHNDPSDLVELWLRLRSEPKAEPRLATVPEASWYLDFHDDVYGYFETTDANVASALACRFLWLLGRSAAAQLEADSPTEAPDNHVLMMCVGDDGGFVAGSREIQLGEDGLSLGSSKIFSDIRTTPVCTHDLRWSQQRGWSVTTRTETP